VKESGFILAVCEPSVRRPSGDVKRHKSEAEYGDQVDL
jgi:hypothetical protein